MKLRIVFILQRLFLLPLLLGGVTLAQGTKPSVSPGQSSGTFEVKINQCYFSLKATEAPLEEIFQEIGKQEKITFDSNIRPEEKVTIHLDRVPLKEGIK